MAQSLFSRLFRSSRLLSKKEEVLLYPEHQPTQWLMDHSYDQVIEKRLSFMRNTPDQALWKAFWELEFPRLMKHSFEKNQPNMTMLLFQGKPKEIPLPNTTLSRWIEALQKASNYGSLWRKEEMSAWMTEIQKSPQNMTPKAWEALGKTASHTFQLSQWCKLEDSDISGERLLEELWKKGCERIDRAEILIRTRLSAETNNQENTNRQTAACMQWALESQPTKTQRQAVADVITKCLMNNMCEYDSTRDPSWYVMAHVIQSNAADTEEFQQLFDRQLYRLRFDKNYFRITNAFKGLVLPSRLQVNEEQANQWAQETAKCWNTPNKVSELTEILAFFRTLQTGGAVSEQTNSVFINTLLDSVPDIQIRVEGLLQEHGNSKSPFFVNLSHLSNQIREACLERGLPEPPIPLPTSSLKPRF